MPTMYKEGRAVEVDPFMVPHFEANGWSSTPPEPIVIGGVLTNPRPQVLDERFPNQEAGILFAGMSFNKPIGQFLTGVGSVLNDIARSLGGGRIGDLFASGIVGSSWEGRPLPSIDQIGRWAMIRYKSLHPGTTARMLGVRFVGIGESGNPIFEMEFTVPNRIGGAVLGGSELPQTVNVELLPLGASGFDVTLDASAINNTNLPVVDPSEFGVGVDHRPPFEEVLFMVRGGLMSPDQAITFLTSPSAGIITSEDDAERDRIVAALGGLVQSVAEGDFPFDPWGSGFGSGGGVVREYTPPDRGSIEDMVRSQLVALVGRADDARVQMLANLWIADDQARFNGESVDPSQSVLERIRSFPDYKRIHKLRPDSVREAEWIARQRVALEAAGLTAEEAADRAITQAQTGTPRAIAGDAGELFGLSQGRTLPGFFQDVNTAARNILEGMP